MHRVRLIHWNEEEAKEPIARLRAAGYRVEVQLPRPGMLREMRENLPAAIVIDLGRLPSHGRDVGLGFRLSKATRHVPLVFVGGEAEKVERVRQRLPDAVYTTWSRIGPSLKRAIARPPANPVVPESNLAGYSGTPLPKKLGIKASTKVAMIGAPEGFEKTLGELPDGASLRAKAVKDADLTLWFTRSRADLDHGIGRIATGIGDGKVWILWPKQASGVSSDLTQAAVREVGLGSGLVDFKVCAVDATWSGLLFTRRKAKRV